MVFNNKVAISVFATALFGIVQLAATQPAHALPSISTDPADFTGPGLTLLDFTTFDASDSSLYGVELTTQIPGVTISGGLFLNFIDPAPDPAVVVPVNGILPPNPGAPAGPFNPITFVFDTTITHFGILGLFNEDFSYDVNSEIGGTTVSGPGQVGVIDPDGMTTVVVSVPSGDGAFAVGTLSFGTRVPEPASLPLIAAGLAALAFLRRKRSLVKFMA